jgi:hypothetical protein
MGDGITIFSVENSFRKLKKSEVASIHVGKAYSGREVLLPDC